MKNPFSPNRVSYGKESNEIDDIFLSIPFTRFRRRPCVDSDGITGWVVYDVIEDIELSEQSNQWMVDRLVHLLNEEFTAYVNNLYAYLQSKD